MSDILTDVADGIGRITLDRPRARNALSRAVLDALAAAFSNMEADTEVRCIVLAATDPVFCAGLDLKELRAPNSPLLGAASRPWRGVTKPIIGAINGAAITGGFELALACDIIVASERAWFQDTHLDVGILPGWGLATALLRAVGVRRALELSLTGRRLTATEAFGLGLVNRVVEHDALAGAATEVASNIAAKNERATAAMHGLYAGLVERDTEALHTLERTHHRSWLDRR